MGKLNYEQPGRTTRRELYRKVYNLNIIHKRDRGQRGFIDVVPHYAGHRNLYQCRIACPIGEVIITKWGNAREVIAELEQKNWRDIMRVANPIKQPEGE